jgi:hypothetical protein
LLSVPIFSMAFNVSIPPRIQKFRFQFHYYDISAFYTVGYGLSPQHFKTILTRGRKNREYLATFPSELHCVRMHSSQCSSVANSWKDHAWRSRMPDGVQCPCSPYQIKLFCIVLYICQGVNNFFCARFTVELPRENYEWYTRRLYSIL